MFKDFGAKVLDTLFPDGIKCIFCGRDIPIIGGRCTCEKCAKELPLNNHKTKCERCDDHIHSMAKFCDRCQNNKVHFDVAISPFVYKDKLVGLIHALKYSNAKYLADPLAEYMAEYFLKRKLKADVIIPVPLHEKRFKRRGYNQAEVLANALGSKLGLPVLREAVERVVDNKTQRKLGYTERRENIKGAFKVIGGKELKGKTIILVDDVLTSGATIEECSKVIKKHATKIIALTVARTVIKK